MKYNRLGVSGLKVSELCLGTMTFGQSTDHAEATAILDAALACGVNFLDTANSYADSRSESMLGELLGARRQDLVVATKFFNPMGPGVNDSGMSRRHILQSVEASLGRLRTDWIDLLYIHHVDEETPLEEMLSALDDLVWQGKVRYIACSNYEAWRMTAALGLSARCGWQRFQANQLQYSLVVRDIEEELVPACLAQNVGVVTWAPLAGGFLTGKYRAGQRSLEGTRSADGWAFPSVYFAVQADQVLETLCDVAASTGATPARVALRWVMSQPAVASCVVGCRTLGQFEDSVGFVDLALDAESRARLDKISRLRPRYPKSMEAGMRERRAAAVGHGS